ncbi:MAG: 3'-5' exonuclease [Acidobacteria bacterium]|nr:3'-5' exonuclease [Acidobacteriota bacterium]
MAWSSPPWEEALYLALDLETSGLDARGDEILALAIVPIRGGVIRFGERFSSLVRPADPSSLSQEGLRAHHLLPGELQAAPPIGELLPEVDRRLRTGTLVLHHAPLDLAFLRQAYRRQGRRWPRPQAVDTVVLLRRLELRQLLLMPHPAPLPASLPAARAALGLPAYPNHDALIDALATAELFLALRARLGAARLRELL